VQKIFTVRSDEEFNILALAAFRYQLDHNPVYGQFVRALNRPATGITHYRQIPFLPVELFKSNRVYASAGEPEITFRSSGTTGILPAIHEVADASLYRSSLLSGFRHFYGDPGEYLICALVPSAGTNPGSSLAFMVDLLIKESGRPGSGCYLNDQPKLAELLGEAVSDTGIRSPGILLFGLTYALLDFAERYSLPLPGAIVMETGGMKGHRREMVREEVHEFLKQAFGVRVVHSEYGMAELLSQAYSPGEGIFRCPPWMKVLIRSVNDPLTWIREGKTGGISIIDLANQYSCPFIATQDLGRLFSDGSFEVLGRFDHSDARGCNLMIS